MNITAIDIETKAGELHTALLAAVEREAEYWISARGTYRDIFRESSGDRVRLVTGVGRVLSEARIEWAGYVATIVVERPGRP